jgi:hypothetical protein
VEERGAHVPRPGSACGDQTNKPDALRGYSCQMATAAPLGPDRRRARGAPASDSGSRFGQVAKYSSHASPCLCSDGTGQPAKAKPGGRGRSRRVRTRRGRRAGVLLGRWSTRATLAPGRGRPATGTCACLGCRRAAPRWSTRGLWGSRCAPARCRRWPGATCRVAWSRRFPARVRPSVRPALLTAVGLDTVPYVILSRYPCIRNPAHQSLRAACKPPALQYKLVPTAAAPYGVYFPLLQKIKIKLYSPYNNLLSR